jgi:hypothetical protein
MNRKSPERRSAQVVFVCTVVPTLVVLLAFTGILQAAAQSYGDWFVETSKATYFYAVSVNDSGNVLGQFCFPGDGSCIWLIGMKPSCKSGARYPVLANSDAGAVHLEVLCDGQLESGLYRYAFTSFDNVDNMVRQSSRVGFAIPLEEDQFRVVRFNTRGGAAALSAMRSAAERRTKPVGRGTRDEKL